MKDSEKWRCRENNKEYDLEKGPDKHGKREYRMG
jgi:hypothetical protein